MNEQPHEHKKIKHISFQIHLQVQLWIEETCDGQYLVMSKNGLPGGQPMVVHTTSNPTHAQMLLDSIKSLFGLSMVEGTEVDVLDLKKPVTGENVK